MINNDCKLRLIFIQLICSCILIFCCQHTGVAKEVEEVNVVFSSQHKVAQNPATYGTGVNMSFIHMDSENYWPVCKVFVGEGGAKKPFRLQLVNTRTGDIVAEAINGGAKINLSRFPTLPSNWTGIYKCRLLFENQMVVDTETAWNLTVIDSVEITSSNLTLKSFNDTENTTFANILCCASGYTQQGPPIVTFLKQANVVVLSYSTTKTNSSSCLNATLEVSNSRHGDNLTVVCQAKLPDFDCTGPNETITYCKEIVKEVNETTTAQVPYPTTQPQTETTVTVNFNESLNMSNPITSTSQFDTSASPTITTRAGSGAHHQAFGIMAAIGGAILGLPIVAATYIVFHYDPRNCREFFCFWKYPEKKKPFLWFLDSKKKRAQRYSSEVELEAESHT